MHTTRHITETVKIAFDKLCTYRYHCTLPHGPPQLQSSNTIVTQLIDWSISYCDVVKHYNVMPRPWLSCYRTAHTRTRHWNNDNGSTTMTIMAIIKIIIVITMKNKIKMSRGSLYSARQWLQQRNIFFVTSAPKVWFSIAVEASGNVLSLLASGKVDFL